MKHAKGLQFQLIMLERGLPVAFWLGTPQRDGSTHISLHIEDDCNVLALAEVFIGLAAELLPPEVRPKAMVLRETLREYVVADDEKDIPW